MYYIKLIILKTCPAPRHWEEEEAWPGGGGDHCRPCPGLGAGRHSGRGGADQEHQEVGRQRGEADCDGCHSRTISFADIGKEGRGLVDTRIYDDTLKRPDCLPAESRRTLRRNGSLSPSTLPGLLLSLPPAGQFFFILGRKPGVISNNGIPILHELRFGSPTMPPIRRKRSASVPEGLHQLLDRNKVSQAWVSASSV